MESPLKNNYLFDEYGNPMMNTGYVAPGQSVTPVSTSTPRQTYNATSIDPMGLQMPQTGVNENMFQLSRPAQESMNAFNPTTSGPGLGAQLGASNFGQRFGANMATPQAMTGMAKGVGGIIQGLVGRGKRRREQQAAQEKYDQMMGRYQQLDTSNLYADVENQYRNMENTMEDLTVNQQQAQFEAQQGAQQRADIMANLRGAAGSSGVAGLAQALANQGQIATQRASASIGMQESRNQMAAAQQAARIQMAERAGEAQAEQLRLSGAERARGLEYQKTGTELGMSQQALAAKNQAIAQADAALYGGIGSVTGTLAMAAVSDRKLKKNINLVGKSPSGLNIYNFEYINLKHGEGVFQGVMSDEIPLDAIVSSSDGYDMVDYSKIDVDFKIIN